MKNTIKTIGLATITAMVLTACVGGDDTPNYTAYPYDAPPISEAQKQAFLSAVNNARAVGRTCGVMGFHPAVPPLEWDDGLYRAAYEHSQDLAATGIFSHDGSGTESDWTSVVQELGRPSTAQDRFDNNVAKVGDTDIISGSENVLLGTTTPEADVQAWLASPMHCSGIMERYNHYIGVASVGAYSTQVFGTSQSRFETDQENQ